MKIVQKIGLALSFMLFYLSRLVWSNLYLAYAILAPRLKLSPGIFEIPVRLKSDQEILFLFNLITMTPGTLSLDISDDKSRLYVHAMFVENEDEFLKEIKDLQERIYKLYN